MRDGRVVGTTTRLVLPEASRPGLVTQRVSQTTPLALESPGRVDIGGAPIPFQRTAGPPVRISYQPVYNTSGDLLGYRQLKDGNILKPQDSALIIPNRFSLYSRLSKEATARRTEETSTRRPSAFNVLFPGASIIGELASRVKSFTPSGILSAVRSTEKEFTGPTARFVTQPLKEKLSREKGGTLLTPLAQTGVSALELTEKPLTRGIPSVAAGVGYGLGRKALLTSITYKRGGALFAATPAARAAGTAIEAGLGLGFLGLEAKRISRLPKELQSKEIGKTVVDVGLFAAGSGLANRALNTPSAKVVFGTPEADITLLSQARKLPAAQRAAVENSFFRARATKQFSQPTPPKITAESLPFDLPAKQKEALVNVIVERKPTIFGSFRSAGKEGGDIDIGVRSREGFAKAVSKAVPGSRLEGTQIVTKQGQVLFDVKTQGELASRPFSSFTKKNQQGVPFTQPREEIFQLLESSTRPRSRAPVDFRKATEQLTDLTKSQFGESSKASRKAIAQSQQAFSESIIKTKESRPGEVVSFVNGERTVPAERLVNREFFEGFQKPKEERLQQQTTKIFRIQEQIRIEGTKEKAREKVTGALEGLGFRKATTISGNILDSPKARRFLEPTERLVDTEKLIGLPAQKQAKFEELTPTEFILKQRQAAIERIGEGLQKGELASGLEKENLKLFPSIEKIRATEKPSTLVRELPSPISAKAPRSLLIGIPKSSPKTERKEAPSIFRQPTKKESVFKPLPSQRTFFKPSETPRPPRTPPSEPPRTPPSEIIRIKTPPSEPPRTPPSEFKIFVPPSEPPPFTPGGSGFSLPTPPDFGGGGFTQRGAGAITKSVYRPTAFAAVFGVTKGSRKDVSGLGIRPITTTGSAFKRTKVGAGKGIYLGPKLTKQEKKEEKALSKYRIKLNYGSFLG